nr:MAG TPA: hypothetical protein [Bacteriophage sp.]
MKRKYEEPSIYGKVTKNGLGKQICGKLIPSFKSFCVNQVFNFVKKIKLWK